VPSLRTAVPNFSAKFLQQNLKQQVHLYNIFKIPTIFKEEVQSKILSMAWCFIGLDLLERRLNTRGLFPSLISSYILFLQQTANNSSACRL